jgi:hypothetical protein
MSVTCCSFSATGPCWALIEDGPGFPRMYRDERVELCRYGAHDPAQVLAQLDMAGELYALVLEAIDLAGWSRPLVSNWP